MKLVGWRPESTTILCFTLVCTLAFYTGSMTFRRGRFAASRFAAGPVRRGRFAVSRCAAGHFLATCYNNFL
jgi:hypothetical protein